LLGGQVRWRRQVAVVRALVRLLFVVALSLALPALAVSVIESWSGAGRAGADYRRARAELDRGESELRAVEERLRLLTSNVAAVEDEARRQLRLIRPGEEFFLLEHEPQPATGR
jgi:cell division protein FtsB